MAQNCFERGEILFDQGEYAAAANIYTEALKQLHAKGGTAQLCSSLLSSRATCHLALGDPTAAAEDCRTGLATDPTSPELHYQLARALALQGDTPGAAAAMAAALALQLPEPLSVAKAELYQNLAKSSAASGSPFVELPASSSDIFYVESGPALARALLNGARFVVLGPGQYSMPPTINMMAKMMSRDYTLLGVGTVTLRSATTHAVWVQQGMVTLANMRLQGAGHGAAICASPLQPDSKTVPHLRMIHCSVEDYPEAGLLLCGGHGELYGCTFRRCRVHAIEVRQGGSLYAVDTCIEECLQGVVAYGGAKCVQLINCSISGTSKEGVLAAGSYENAATQAQNIPGVHNRKPEKYRSASARKATEEAEAWAKQRGRGFDLEVELTNCTVSKCGCFGLSLDSGCRVAISGCRLDNNDPYSVFIKGGTDAVITACQFVYSGRSNKSLWAQHSAGGQALKMAGVQIGANYAGEIQVIGNAFAGPQEQAVYSEFTKKYEGMARSLGMWTKPPSLVGNNYFSKPEQLPSLEALAAQVGVMRPGGSILGSSQQRTPRTPTVAELCRPSSVFQQPGWSPTADQYYAIGNTHGYNITAGLLPTHSNTARILLAGCGDIRNLLATATALYCIDTAQGSDSSTSTEQLNQLQFVLNDGNISMLARNAVMLYMAVELAASAESILAVWANLALSQPDFDLVLQACEALAENPWPAWLCASSTLDVSASTIHAAAAAPAVASASSSKEGSSSKTATETTVSAERQVRTACAAWATSTVTVTQLLQWRDNLNTSKSVGDTALALSLSAVGCAANDSSSLQKEVRNYIRSGSLPALTSIKASKQQQLKHPNPTFLSAPSLQYTVYYSSSIFRAVPLAHAEAGSKSAAHRLLATIRPQVAAVVSGVHSGNLKVQLVPGDILAVATSAPFASSAEAVGRTGGEGSCTPGIDHGITADTSAPGLFDYIDTSNVSDYTSVPALLQACAALLLPSAHARLRLESIVAYNKSGLPRSGLPPAEFATASLGMSVHTHAALLGLQFLGGSVLPDSQKTLRLEWGCTTATAQSSEQPVSSADRDDLPAQQLNTAGSLFLDLKPAFKHFVEAYLVDPVLHSGSNGRVDWRVQGSPVTLVHLASLAAAASAGGVVRAFLRTASRGGMSGPAGLFKWELTMHAGINVASTKSCIHISFPVNAGYRLLSHVEHPLLLAISSVTLKPGLLGLTSVQQLLTSFAYDDDMGTATVLLPESLSQLEACPSWAAYITLCVISSEGLEAIGESRQLPELLTDAAVVPVQPWRALPRTALPVVIHGQQGIDLINQIESGASGTRKGGWQAAVHIGSSQVVIDILAPNAIHPDAAVKVTVTDNQLTVSLSEGSARQKTKKQGVKHAGQDDRLCQGSYSVQLPAGTSLGQPSTKMSRVFGLLSVRLAVTA